MDLAHRLPSLRSAAAALVLAALVLPSVALAALASGPPYPPPVNGQRVYDTAEIFDAATIAAADATIAGIDARTGAEVVVYTEDVDYGITSDEAESNAQALMDQWGVGRQGFDDGLVILFDIDPSGCHGQIQLYAGPGYRAAYLSNDQRDSIFNDDMLPELEACDMDGALAAGLAKVDAAATPQNAENLSRGRIINALVGLVLAPAIILVSIGAVSIGWYRRGRDAVYTDDSSVLMPAPPPDLTPASAALVYDDRSSRRALTAAMLDLASRGLIAFDVPDPKHPSLLAVELAPPAATDPGVEAARAKAARQKLTDAETYALAMLRLVGGEGDRIEPDELPQFGKYASTFNAKLEDHAVAQGWFGVAPTKAIGRYSTWGAVELLLGFVAFVVGSSIPFSGLIFVAVGLVVGGVGSIAIAQAMPARTT
ncbi:MAG TPA: TPM domain-containing protein, partial [Candidatus Limnocylindrales bacterium]|nr:TPM domain-containing protein [Candidatus Limnocylindrales bacterium]